MQKHGKSCIWNCSGVTTEEDLAAPQKLAIDLPCGPAVLILGTYLRGREMGIQIYLEQSLLQHHYSLWPEAGKNLDSRDGCRVCGMYLMLPNSVLQSGKNGKSYVAIIKVEAGECVREITKQQTMKPNRERNPPGAEKGMFEGLKVTVEFGAEVIAQRQGTCLLCCRPGFDPQHQIWSPKHRQE